MISAIISGDRKDAAGCKHGSFMMTLRRLLVLPVRLVFVAGWQYMKIKRPDK
jgi:hypothetical protein